MKSECICYEGVVFQSAKSPGGRRRHLDEKEFNVELGMLADHSDSRPPVGSGCSCDHCALGGVSERRP
jgi:hypothetical protein